MDIANYKFDIVIIAGQSNAEGNGYGNEKDRIIVNDNVYQLVDVNPVEYSDEFGLKLVAPTVMKIEPFIERLNGDMHVAEFATSFAEKYSKNDLKDDRKLLIVKTSVGGMGFVKKQWGVGYELSNRLLDMVNYALSLNPSNKIVAMLWHQGEHDAYESNVLKYDYETIKQNYHDNLYNQFKLIRDTYNSYNFPIIAGDFCYHWGNLYPMELMAVKEATNEVLTELGNGRFVQAADLHSNQQDTDIQDNIHFSRKSLYVLGDRYYDAYKNVSSFHKMALVRQSTRSFKDKEVELEKLTRICEVARLSPSACDSQPWKLHIVRPTYSKLDELRKSMQIVGLNKFLNEVNNFIVIEQVFGNKSATLGSKFSRNDLNSIDIGLIASHICFEAEQQGLGTVMIGAFRRNVILKAMNFKKNQRIRLVIAIGYPKDNYPIRKKVRKESSQVYDIIDK